MINPNFFTGLIAVFFVVVFCAVCRNQKKRIDKDNERGMFL